MCSPSSSPASTLASWSAHLTLSTHCSGKVLTDAGILKDLSFHNQVRPDAPNARRGPPMQPVPCLPHQPTEPTKSTKFSERPAHRTKCIFHDKTDRCEADRKSRGSPAAQQPRSPPHAIVAPASPGTWAPGLLLLRLVPPLLHVFHHHQELGGTISRERGSLTKQQKQEGGTRLEFFFFAILNFQF